MICKSKRILGNAITTSNGREFNAPAVLYRGPRKGITDEPNGDPVTYLNSVSGEELAEGPVYLAPCGGLTNEPNGSPLFGLVGGSSAPLITVDGVLNLVPISASIMDQAFTDEIAAAQEFYKANGISAKVYNRAVSGDRVEDTLADLPANLAEFAGQEASTVFIYHGPGNNVTVNGPYPGGAEDIETGITQVISDILAAGFYCVSSNITYRIPPGSNPTDPYNVNIINPTVASLLPEWVDSSGVPTVDMYSLMFDNQLNWIEADGVHPNEAGEAGIRAYWADKVGAEVQQTNAPVVSISDTVISCGANFGDAGFENILPVGGSITAPSNVGDPDVNIFGTITTDTTLRSSSGRGNAGDTSESLTNDFLLTWYLYVSDDTVQTIGIDVGVDYEATYTVRVTASRDTSATDRVTEYNVSGVIKTIDAAANPPEIVEFTGVTGQDLLDNGLLWYRQAGSTFGYLNGIQVVRE